MKIYAVVTPKGSIVFDDRDKPIKKVVSHRRKDIEEIANWNKNWRLVELVVKEIDENN